MRCQGRGGKVCCGAFGVDHAQSCLSTEQAKHIFSGLAGRLPEHLSDFFADFGIYTLNDAMEARRMINFDLSDEILFIAFAVPDDHERARLTTSPELSAEFTVLMNGQMSFEEVLTRLLTARTDVKAVAAILLEVDDTISGTLAQFITRHPEASVQLQRALDVDSFPPFYAFLRATFRKRARS